MHNDVSPRQSVLAWAPLVAATASLAWIVPESPFAHLDDPSHWGVLGYLGCVGALAGRWWRGRLRPPRRLLAIFLTGMPLVYLANWLRWGGDPTWLGIETVGLILFGTAAWLGCSRSGLLLASGIATHAVWDAAHLGGPSFVPDWYATGCAIVDVALGGFAGHLWVLSGEAARASEG